MHAYVATPGGKTSYLSELKAGKEVMVVDQTGKMRTAIVGRVKIETRPLILVEAKVCLSHTLSTFGFATIRMFISNSIFSTRDATVLLQIDANDQTVYSILLQTAETVALVCPHEGLLRKSS